MFASSSEKHLLKFLGDQQDCQFPINKNALWNYQMQKWKVYL